MTQNGDPYENAVAERMNGIIKHEILPHPGFTHFELAQQKISQAIKAYNSLRPHRSCNMLTPEQAHSQTGKLKRKWKLKTYNHAKPNSERPSHQAKSYGTPPLALIAEAKRTKKGANQIS